MRKQFLSFILLIFLTIFPFIINAQMICDINIPTNNTWPLTILNVNGGSHARDGIRTEITGSGNIQIFRNNQYQIYNGNLQSGNPNNVPGTTHGWILTVGNSGNSNNQYSFRSGSLTAGSSSSFQGATQVRPVSTECINQGNTQTRRMNYNLVSNGRTYQYVLTYSYTFPNNYITINHKVTIPQGNTLEVKLSHGWDTYLAGGDRGPGFLSGAGNNLTVGTQKTVMDGGERTVVYEAFKFNPLNSTTPWSGYYSGAYTNMNSILSSNSNRFNNVVTTTETDNGIGISMNFGAIPGTYTSESQLIFKCEAPTYQPIITFPNQQASTASCGKPVDITTYFRGTSENPNLTLSNLPSGVTLKVIDANGNNVNPKSITRGGTYSVFFEDANNAGCLSPTTQITISEIACCNTTPVLIQNTLTNTCPTENVNLNKLYEGILPTGVNLIWYNNPNRTGSPIADPANIKVSGTYYAFIYDSTNNCHSSVSTGVTVNIADCCDAGYSAPLTY